MSEKKKSENVCGIRALAPRQSTSVIILICQLPRNRPVAAEKALATQLVELDIHRRAHTDSELYVCFFPGCTKGFDRAVVIVLQPTVGEKLSS